MTSIKSRAVTGKRSSSRAAKSGSARLIRAGLLGSTALVAVSLAATGAMAQTTVVPTPGDPAPGQTAIAGGTTLQLNNTSGSVNWLDGYVFTGAGTLETNASGGASAFALRSEMRMSAGGVLNVNTGQFSGSSDGQGNWTNNLGSLNINAGATFDGVEGAIFIDALTGSGRLAGGFAGSRTTTIGVANGSGTFNGIITDTSNTGQTGWILALTHVGTGTQTLTGVNTFTGATTITGGAIALSGSGSISQSGSLSIGSSGAFDITGLAGGTTVNSLQGAGSVILGANTLTATGASSTFSGSITGSGGITHTGANTLTLTGTNNWTGVTTISQGVLAGTASSISGSSIVVNASGFGLTYNDTVAGTVTQNISGTGIVNIATAAALTFTGDITTNGRLLLNYFNSNVTLAGTRSGGTDYAVLATGTFTVADTGQVLGGAYIGVSANNTVTVNNFGLVSTTGTSGTGVGLGSAMRFTNSSVVNNGSVTDAVASITGIENGVYTETTASSTVRNYGSITGTNAFGVRSAGTGALSLTNYTGGTITGGAAGVFASGVLNLTNTGTITGNGATSSSGGIVLAVGGTVTNNAGGAINGAYFGILNNANGLTVVNNGAITGSDAGIFTHGVLTYSGAGSVLSQTQAGIATMAGGTINVGAGGSITGQTQGIYNNAGGLGVTNAGSITGQAHGIYNNGGTLSVTNSVGGQITGTIGVMSTGGTLALTNFGTITGTNAGLAGVNAVGSGSVITNHATIQGGAQAIVLNNGGTVHNLGASSVLGTTNTAALTDASGIYSNGALTLINEGTISTASTGASHGVQVLGVAAITNTGSITAANGSGVFFNGGGSSLVNSGTITGGASASIGYGVQNAAASGLSTITNQAGGVIGGGAGSILLSGAGNTDINLQAGSTTNGQILSTAGGTHSVTIAGALNGAYNAATGSGIDNLILAATGSMTSANLGAGNDTFNHQGGTFSGLIDGGSGTDTFNANLGVGNSASVNVGNIANFEFQNLNSGTLTLTGARSGSVGWALSAGTTAIVSGQLTNNTSSFTLNNSALQLTSTGVLSRSTNTVQLNNGLDAVTNAGTITATSGNAINSSVGGTVTNLAGGQISGSGNNNAAVYLGTGTQTVTNSGTITGTGSSVSAVWISGGSLSLTNNAGGTLSSGSATAIRVDSGTATIINSGTVTAAGSGYGFRTNGGNVTITNNASGIFEATGTGGAILGNGSGTLSVTNSGIIRSAISFSSWGTLGIGGAGGSFTNLSGGQLTASGTDPALSLSGSGLTTVDLQAGSTVTGAIRSTSTGDRTVNIAGLLTGTYTATGSGISNLTLAATGSITGAVTLGAGNDSFTWQGGTFGSTINGGTGTNAFNSALGMGSGTLNLADISNFQTLTHQSGTMTLTGASAAPFSTILAGTGVPSGTLIFNGTSGLNSAITVNGAVVRAATAGALGTGTITMLDPTIEYGATGTYANNILLSVASPASADPSTFNTDAGVTATLSGSLTRGGGDTAQPVVIGGLGTIILTNSANSWTGTTTINTGATLQGMSNTISGSNTVANGVLHLLQPTSGTFAQNVSGSGTVQVSGLNAGQTLTLSGALTNANGVQVTSGSDLAVTGSVNASNSSAVFATVAGASITNSGTITGNGSIFNSGVRLNDAGTITNLAGGTIRSNGGEGINAVNSSVFNAAGGTISGALRGIFLWGANSSVDNSGTISGGTLSGLSLNDGGSLINRSGGLINTVGGHGVVAGLGASTITNNGSIQGTTSGILFVTGGSLTNTGTISGATGVSASGATQALNLVSSGTITGTGGTAIALSGQANIVNLQAGSTTTGQILSTAGGTQTVTIAGILNGAYNAATGSGVDNLTLAATGSMTSASLGAGNDSFTWQGGTFSGLIDGGAGTNAFSSALGMGSGTLNLADISNFQTLTHQSGTMTLTGASASPFSTILAGTGVPSGTLIFNGTSGLNSAITVNGAVIRAATAGAFGTGTITMINPTIEYGATGTYANNILLSVASPASADPSTFNTDAGVTATLSGSITRGAGDVSQPVVFGGLGTIVLTNSANIWAGTTTINSGATLQGMSNTISGSRVINNGTLAFNQNAGGIFGLDVSGTGTVIASGGSLTLGGALTQAGGTTLNGNAAVTLTGSASSNTSVFTLAGNGSLTVAAGATVNSGLFSSVLMTGTGSTVTNLGSINNASANGDGTGAAILSQIASGANVIHNGSAMNATAGLTGYASGIFNANAAGTTLTVNNWGLIHGYNNQGIYGGTIGSILNVNNLAGGTISGLYGGILGQGLITVSNAGTISSAGGSGIQAYNGSLSVTNLAGGVISGHVYGIDAGNAGTFISNAGAISGIVGVQLQGGTVQNLGGGTISASNQGILSWVSGTSVDNAGTISATNGHGVYLNAGGSLTNSGTITGGNHAFIGVGTSTVTNQLGGVMTGGIYNAVYTGGAGSVIDNAGLMTGGNAAVYTDGANTSLTNTGTIRVTGTSVPTVISGVYMSGAGSSVTNSGTIESSLTDGRGVFLAGGSGTIINQSGGTISGNGTGAAIILAGDGYSLDLQTGSTVNGLIDASATTGLNTVTIAGDLNGAYAGGSGSDVVTLVAGATFGALLGADGIDALILAGLADASLDIGQTTGFESRTMSGDGTWALSGTDSEAADWTLDSGTLRLTGGVSVHDAAGIRVNSGATLSVGDSEAIGALNGTGSVVIDASQMLYVGVNDADSAFSGIIAGAGGLSQSGAGSLTLYGANTYTGDTRVDAGTLRLGASDVIADTSRLIVQTGTTLDLQGFNDTVGVAYLNGTLQGSGTLTAADQFLNGAVINANLGAGFLANAGGVSTLNGTSAAGTVSVLAGTLRLGASERLANTASLSVSSGATLDLQGHDETVAVAWLNGTVNGQPVPFAPQPNIDAKGVDGPLTLPAPTGTGTLTAAEYQLNGATINANLGAGNLFNTGGVSTLNGTAAAGSVAVQAGTLVLGASDRLADTATVSVSTGATLDQQAFNETVGLALLNGTLAGTGTLSAAQYQLDGATIDANLGTGSLFNLGGASTLNGTSAAGSVSVQAGTLRLGASERLADTATLSVSSGATLDLRGFDETVAAAWLNGTLDGSVAQVIPALTLSTKGTDGPLTIPAPTGPGTLTAAQYVLNGATINANLGTGSLFNTGGVSTLNGTVAASSVSVQAGTLALGADDRLADTATVSVSSGATLNLNAFSDTVGLALLNGTLAGTGTLTAAQYQLVGATVNANLGAGTLFNLGGVSTLNGTAAAGLVSVQAGTLRLGASERLANTATVSVSSGATFDVNGRTETIGALYGMGTVAIGAGQLSFGGADSAFGGSLSGSGSLVHTGGLFTLMGSHTLGSLRNTGGELRFYGTTTGGVAVTGGSLTGAGTIGGALSVSGGATLSPGLAGQYYGLGTVSAGSLTLNGGTLTLDLLGRSLGNASDRLVISGTATLTGGIVAPVFQGPASNYDFLTRYQFLTAGQLVGTFSNGAAFTADATRSDLFWRVRYDLTANAAVMEVRHLIDFNPGVGGTGNQTAVGAALTGGQLQASDDWAGVLNLLGGLTVPQRQAAFDSLGGEALADISSSLFAANDAFTGAVRDAGVTRTQGLAPLSFASAFSFVGERGGAAAMVTGVLDAFDPSAGAGTGRGGWISVHASDIDLEGKVGQADLQTRLNGFVGGYAVGNGDYVLGAAAGATRVEGDVAGRQSAFESDLVHAAGYLRFDDGRWAADVTASAYGGEIESRRLVTIGAFTGQALGKAGGEGQSVSASVARRFADDSGGAVSVGVMQTLSRSTVEAFTERAAGGLSLEVADQERNWQTTQLNLRATQDYRLSGQPLRLYGGVGMLVTTGDREATADMRFSGAAAGFGGFTIEGAQAAPLAGVTEFGLEYQPREGLTLSTGYRAVFSDRLNDNQVGARMSIAW